MLSRSKKILIILNSKQKRLPTGNRRTLPQRDTETEKNDKRAFGSDTLD